MYSGIKPVSCHHLLLWMDVDLTIKKLGQPFEILMPCQHKLPKKLCLELHDEILVQHLLHNFTGAFCVWVKV